MSLPADEVFVGGYHCLRRLISAAGCDERPDCGVREERVVWEGFGGESRVSGFALRSLPPPFSLLTTNSSISWSPPPPPQTLSLFSGPPVDVHSECDVHRRFDAACVPRPFTPSSSDSVRLFVADSRSLVVILVVSPLDPSRRSSPLGGGRRPCTFRRRQSSWVALIDVSATLHS